MATSEPNDKEPTQGSDLLTFGEAAEYAAVSLMDLRDRLRAQSVTPEWGWRGGVAVQLVRLPILEQLYPVLQKRRKKLGPSLDERGIVLVSPTNKSSQPGGKPLASKFPDLEPPAQEATDSLSEISGESAEVDRPLEDSPELQALYNEIEAATTRNEQLLRELGGVARTKATERKQPTPVPTSEFAETAESSDIQARNDEWKRLVSSESKMERSHRRVQWISWALAAALLVILGIKGKDVLLAGDTENTQAFPETDPHRVAKSNPSSSELESSTQGTTRKPSEDQTKTNTVTGLKASAPSDSIADEGPALVSFQEAVGAPNLTRHLEVEVSVPADPTKSAKPVAPVDSSVDSEVLPTFPTGAPKDPSTENPGTVSPNKGVQNPNNSQGSNTPPTALDASKVSKTEGENGGVRQADHPPR